MMDANLEIHAADIGPLFDADNHYWESSDAFTRHRNPKFLDRGLRVVPTDGTLRYFIGDRPHPILPGPGDVNPRPRPGALYGYFSGMSDKGALGNELTSENPAEHPEWFNRDARLQCMDGQGLKATWLFPSHAVCLEGPMQPDIEAALEVLRAFNRWLEEDWGFAYSNRIFGVPYLSLSSLDGAITELNWCLEHGARVVSIRNGPVFTREGLRSPADPMFDPFWALVQEAGIVVAPHAGYDDGYREVDDSVARAWGYGRSERSGDTNALNVSEPFVDMLMKHRLVHDFAAALVVHGLYERFPRLRVAFIENGGGWVGPLLHSLQLFAAQHPGAFSSSPVDQFIEHCWVAPFVEDSVADLATHLPVERILFGSDWPHAEGLHQPKDFLAGLSGFSPEAVRKIMVDNTSELTFHR
jgi:predicted TIM-barrel fold metal-dependent hydrolase